jgi:hypothetical protein
MVNVSIGEVTLINFRGLSTGTQRGKWIRRRRGDTARRSRNQNENPGKSGKTKRSVLLRGTAEREKRIIAIERVDESGSISCFSAGLYVIAGCTHLAN